MSINLRLELIELLEQQGLGRLGYLRKAVGSAANIAAGGEYDPKDNTLSGGKPYLDYPVIYYRTTNMASERKDETGTTMFDDQVIYLAVKDGQVAPSKRDSLVEIQHDINGNPVEPHLIARIIPINSIIEQWADINGQSVYFAVSSTHRRTGERGVA